MLRGLVICPDSGLADRLAVALQESRQVTIVRDLDHYPDSLELMRVVRAHSPEVVFLAIDAMAKAGEIVTMVEREALGLQVIAISQGTDPAALLKVMRSGIREFLAVPFAQHIVQETLARVEEMAQKRPPTVQSTDQLYAFLPSKQGVGTSTVALNMAVALARDPETGVLLMDMDLSSGIISFMLKLNNANSVIDAAENSHALDESNWPQLVSRVSNMDVLHAGRVNPDFRIDSAQIRRITDFARRHYRAICVDLSGNLERYSLEVMHESKRIFMVVTPEIPSLHLAREKLAFLQHLDLADRVSVLLNRCHKRSVVTPAQIESLLGVPVAVQFSNDYYGVHRALQSGKAVDPASELGRQCTALANSILGRKAPAPEPAKRRLADYFSLLPSRPSALAPDQHKA